MSAAIRSSSMKQGIISKNAQITKLPSKSENIQSLSTANPFAALAQGDVPNTKAKEKAKTLTTNNKNSKQNPPAKQKSTLNAKTPSSQIKVSKSEPIGDMTSIKKIEINLQHQNGSIHKLILSGLTLASQFIPTSASSSNNDFLNPNSNFTTPYTIDGESLSVKRMLALISQKCGSQSDFRILDPAIHFVKWTIWASVRSKDKEENRQASFDDCIKEQVEFVARQNDLILGCIVGIGGAIILGTTIWYYRDKISSFISNYDCNFSCFRNRASASALHQQNYASLA